jgi:hypothetical protein
MNELRNFLRDGRVFLSRLTITAFGIFCLGVYYISFEPEFYMTSRQRFLVPYLTWLILPVWAFFVAWSFILYRRNAKGRRNE